MDNFRDVSKTACTLANASGGRIAIGVTSDGKVLGPEPAFEELGSFFRVTLCNKKPAALEPVLERQTRLGLP